MAWHRAPAIAALLLLLPLAGGSCHRARARTFQPGNVVPEDEDEQRSRRPSRLGGPKDGIPSAQLKNRVTPPLDDFIENLTDDQLVNYLSQLQYDMGPDNSQRVRASCVHNPTGSPHPIPAPKRCNLGDGADVAIEPEVGMHLQDFSAIPEHGVIAARIINYDKEDREEKTYGFPPNTRVWWVVDRPNGVLRSRFFVRTYLANHAVRQIRDAADSYPFVNCHPDVGHDYAQARFAKCVNAPHMTKTSSDASRTGALAAPVGVLSLAAGAPFTSAISMPTPTEMVIDGTWVTCRGGCCATSP